MLVTGAVALLVRLWRTGTTVWAAASVVSGLLLAAAVVATGLAGGRLAR